MTLCSSVIFAVISFTIFSTSSVTVVRTLDVAWIEVAVFPVVTIVLLTSVDLAVVVINVASTELSCVVVSTVLSCVVASMVVVIVDDFSVLVIVVVLREVVGVVVCVCVDWILLVIVVILVLVVTVVIGCPVLLAAVVLDGVDVVRQLFSSASSSYSCLVLSSLGFAAKNTPKEYSMKLFTASLPVSCPILFWAAMILSTRLITSLYLFIKISRSLQVRSLTARLLF